MKTNYGTLRGYEKQEDSCVLKLSEQMVGRSLTIMHDSTFELKIYHV